MSKTESMLSYIESRNIWAVTRADPINAQPIPAIDKIEEILIEEGFAPRRIDVLACAEAVQARINRHHN